MLLFINIKFTFYRLPQTFLVGKNLDEAKRKIVYSNNRLKNLQHTCMENSTQQPTLMTLKKNSEYVKLQLRMEHWLG